MEVETEVGWSVTEDNGDAFLDGSFEVVSLDKSPRHIDRSPNRHNEALKSKEYINRQVVKKVGSRPS
jgi:hypothetical protein